MKKKDPFILITYLENYVDECGHILRRFKKKKYSTKHIRCYANHIHLLAKLDRCSVLLIHYLADHCTPWNNEFFNTISTRKEFIHFCSKNCSVHFKDETVKKGISRLVKVGFLLKYAERAVYTVNPVYFFRGTEEQRKMLLSELLAHCSSGTGKIDMQLKRAIGLY
jgi:hypothetical protein